MNYYVHTVDGSIISLNYLSGVPTVYSVAPSNKAGSPPPRERLLSDDFPIAKREGCIAA
jgi:hypothetical protein